MVVFNVDDFVVVVMVKLIVVWVVWVSWDNIGDVWVGLVLLDELVRLCFMLYVYDV